MGDRANVVIRHANEEVWLYTHWGGSSLPGLVHRVLKRQARWNDPSYLARMIFSAMIANDIHGETGFGIGASRMWVDNSYPLLVLEIGDEQQYLRFVDEDAPRRDGTGMPFTEVINKRTLTWPK